MSKNHVEAPKDIEACFEADSTAVGLKKFSDFLARLAGVAAFILSIIGFIAAGVGSSNISKIYEMFGKEDKDLTGVYFFVVLLIWCAIAFVSWVIIMMLSHLMMAQSKKVQSVKTIANINMYHLCKEEGYTPPEPVEEKQTSGLRFCGNCGNTIPDGAEFCVKCGQKKI